MEINEIKPIIEAMIFAGEEPLTLNAIVQVFNETGIEKSKIEEALECLAKDYNEEASKGLMLRQVSGGWQLVTKPTLAQWVQKLNISKPRTLSQPSLETLAVVAYRQPVLRSEIEVIRGVDSGGVLKTLLERGLVKIMGRKEEAGQPLIYGTTPAFLELFHLKNLEELPSMKEIELMVTEQQQTEENALNEPIVVEPQWDAIEGVLEEANLGALNMNNLGDEGDALSDLENSIKDLRRLEQEMFPKEEASATAEEAPAAPSPEGASEPEL